jgi:histone acetyltransferase (RNA polymerase elongator complex component)
MPSKALSLQKPFQEEWIRKDASRPHILPVFLPHLGCPERCVFCNQKAVAQVMPTPSFVEAFVERSVKTFPTSRPRRERQIAFYGGSFTAIAPKDQRRYLESVRPALLSGQIDSIRISTRPDSLDHEALDLLQDHGVRTIEIGAQSMVDRVLSLSHRGHTSQDTTLAVSRLRERGFEVGLHLMLGLPGEGEEDFLHTLNRTIELRPDFVRIHPTLILRGTRLETLWRQGDYLPLSLEETVRWLEGALLRFEEARIRVVRVGLQPTAEIEAHYLAGPYHPALRELVEGELFFHMAKELLERSHGTFDAAFSCHPRAVSKLRGQRNGNIDRLKALVGLRSICVRPEKELEEDVLVLRTERSLESIQKQDLLKHGNLG